ELRPEDHLAVIVAAPVGVQEASLPAELLEQRGAGIRRQDVKRRHARRALLDEAYRLLEDALIVIVEPEDDRGLEDDAGITHAFHELFLRGPRARFRMVRVHAGDRFDPHEQADAPGARYEVEQAAILGEPQAGLRAPPDVELCHAFE